MSNIDEISLKLGSLEAKHESIDRQLTVIGDKMDKALDKITLMNGSVGKAHKRMDDITHPETGSLTIASKRAEDWVETKKKAKWIIGGISLTGGLGGLSLGNLIKNLIG